jgi:hypothetical protein
MPQKQAPSITMLFPTDLASQQWFEDLALILNEIPGSRLSPGKIVLSAINPEAALPCIQLIQAPVAYPQLVFELDQPLDLPMGEFKITNRPLFSETANPPESFSGIKPLEDSRGPYLRLTDATRADFLNLLTIEQLYDRLKGHLVRADHFGVNLPVSQVARPLWTDLLDKLAAQTNLYRYPEGFEWPFIIPATQPEFAADITRFEVGRQPRFELVYDEYLRYPLYQFALVTDLNKAELERRFPLPYGNSIPGLEDFFRSIYIFHPWPGFGIRFDMYYAGDGGLDDWQSGEWLVKSGGRIKPGP